LPKKRTLKLQGRVKEKSSQEEGRGGRKVGDHGEDWTCYLEHQRVRPSKSFYGRLRTSDWVLRWGIPTGEGHQKHSEIKEKKESQKADQGHDDEKKKKFQKSTNCS